MKWALLISACVELLGAVFLYFNGDLIFPESNVVVNKLYAILAFVIAMICFIVWKHGQEDKTSRFIFLTIMFFHAAVSFVVFSSPVEWMPYKLEACILHMGIFVIFFMAYMKEIGPEKKH